MQQESTRQIDGEPSNRVGDAPKETTAIYGESPAPADTTLETPKRKRRCLRLDVRHSRNVLFTTFYRIWMYRKRHLFLTLLQILIPPLILIGMTAYLGTLLQIKERNWTHYEPLDEMKLHQKICGTFCIDGQKGIIGYYLANNNTRFAKYFSEDLKTRFAKYNIDLKQVDQRKDMITSAIRQELTIEKDIFIAGIEIDNPSPDPLNSQFGVGQKFHLEFTVSVAQNAPGFFFAPSPVFFDLARNNPNQYNQLLGIQLAVLRTFHGIIQKERGRNFSNKILIETQPLSYPPHSAYTLKSDFEKVANDMNLDGELDNYQGIDSMLATILVLSILPVFYTVVEGPVTEKENGFKLYLHLMGFPRGAYWFHWILNQMIIQVIVVAIQTWLLFTPFNPNTGPLVNYGDPTLWFCVLLLYNLSCLSFCTSFAAFCRRGKMATYLGILIWLLSFQMLQTHIFDIGSGFSLFMISCLIPCGCIHWAIYILTTVRSITWEISLHFALTQQSGFKLPDVLLMMVLNFFVYFLLTLYVDNLNPGPKELGQPWNYFFENILCRFIDPNKDVVEKTPLTSTTKVANNANSRPANEPAIEFKKLSKKFYLFGGVFGVENVQFNVYSGAITVLLGHNDSGRTTLMRLLCGACAPTSGTIIVFGYNVRKYTQKVQSFLNVCMEDDLLCEYLTVMEHMQLIAKLKGVNRKRSKEEAINILESVGLLSHKSDMMWKLAKWQRRVLCVAMALIGDAPILCLDNPTVGGLESDAKRQIWKVLKDLKGRGKTILFSSHDMEEAYQVADRIVLMSRGRVVGVGAPSKLEKILDTGYHLNLKTIPNASSKEILTFIKEHVPTAREREGGLKQVKRAVQVENWDQQNQSVHTLDNKSVKSKTVIDLSLPLNKSDETLEVNVADHSATHAEMQPLNSAINVRDSFHFKNNIMYLLPYNECANFPALFRALNDDAMLKLGIKEFELKWHSIENAFEEIDDYVDVLYATDESQLDTLDTKLDYPTIGENSSYTPMPSHYFNMEKKCCSCWRGVWALIIKRINHVIGNYRYVICQMMAPLLILLIVISSTNLHFSNDLLSPALEYDKLPDSDLIPYRMEPNDLEGQSLFKSFKTVVRRGHNHISKFRNIGTSKFTEHYNEENIYQLHDEIEVAADFTQVKNGKVTALFSPGHHHSAPLSLLLMFNTLLEHEFSGNGSKYTVGMSGKSMKHGKQLAALFNSTFPQSIIAAGVDVTLAVSLAFGYFIFTSGFVIQPCSERLCQLKRYQMYNLEWNGLYWIATAVVDTMCNFLLTVLLTTLIYYAPSHEIFKDPQFIILFVITTLLGGFASIISTYGWSHIWLKKSTSYYATLSVNQFFGLFIFLFYTIINFDYFGSQVGTIVAYCLQVLQPFSIPWNFHAAILWALDNGHCNVLHPLLKQELCRVKENVKASMKEAQAKCCSLGKGTYECHAGPRDWNLDFIWSSSNVTTTPLWTNIVFLLYHCVAGMLILMYMESRRRRRNLLRLSQPQRNKPPAIINPNDAISIKYEETFVCEKSHELDKGVREKLFIVESLSTSIGHHILLHTMSFAVEAGKCTVIVGPETAGITTLYEILAGLRAISEGSVSYGGCDLFSWGTRRKFLQKMGLSSSQDVLLDKLSGQQLLALFGRLRGIPSKDLQKHIDYWAERLGLQRKIKKQCASYSNVLKRKLNIACAIIGNPSVIVLEHPTKSLDPISKSQVCKAISSLVNDQRVVIVLTHDLGSVHNLCNKLIILVNGQMQFCEKAENIYEEISEEFTLTIKLKGNEHGKIDFKMFTSFVHDLESAIESMTLQEEQSHLLMYRIKNEKYNWAMLFESVEKVVSNHPKVVLDYNIRKTSLEDVYNSYAVKQQVFRTTKSAWAEFRTTYC